MIISLALRKRLQAIIQALVTSVVAAIGGWIIAFLTGLLPAYLTAPLSVDRAIATQGSQTGSVIAINLVIVTLCALFTSPARPVDEGHQVGGGRACGSFSFWAFYAHR